MEIKTYFFDTYAFHEIIVGNKAYSQYTKCNIITTKLNLMELYYTLLIKYNKEIAELYYDMHIDYCIEITDEIIKEAMIFKKNNRKKYLSYIDCIGYILAKMRGIKFLTGDKEFKDLDNVEFVK